MARTPLRYKIARMYFPNHLFKCFRPVFWFCRFLLLLTPLAAAAQDEGATKATYTIVKSIKAPIGEQTDSYQVLAARNGAKTDPVYVTELDGQLASGKARITPQGPSRNLEPVDLNGYGVALAIGILLGALFLWLKFGGSGVLLARDPAGSTPKNSAPDNWKISNSEINLDANSRLDQIAAMPDRGAAMVLLLRYCLLAAAQTTSTRFARSDTERSAFGRLPVHWPHLGGLETVLQQAELAHYGGRPVSDGMFDKALETGRTILNANQKTQGT